LCKYYAAIIDENIDYDRIVDISEYSQNLIQRIFSETVEIEEREYLTRLIEEYVSRVFKEAIGSLESASIDRALSFAEHNPRWLHYYASVKRSKTVEQAARELYEKLLIMRLFPLKNLGRIGSIADKLQKIKVIFSFNFTTVLDMSQSVCVNAGYLLAEQVHLEDSPEDLLLNLLVDLTKYLPVRTENEEELNRVVYESLHLGMIKYIRSIPQKDILVQMDSLLRRVVDVNRNLIQVLELPDDFRKAILEKTAIATMVAILHRLGRLKGENAISAQELRRVAASIVAAFTMEERSLDIVYVRTLEMELKICNFQYINLLVGELGIEKNIVDECCDRVLHEAIVNYEDYDVRGLKAVSEICRYYGIKKHELEEILNQAIRKRISKISNAKNETEIRRRSERGAFDLDLSCRDEAEVIKKIVRDVNARFSFYSVADIIRHLRRNAIIQEQNIIDKVIFYLNQSE
nr:hypothetical protein [Pseudomonadota bacterium]